MLSPWEASHRIWAYGNNNDVAGYRAGFDSGRGFTRHGGRRAAIKTRVVPVYPEIAKRMRIGGTVNIQATVDAEGTVKDVKTVSGNHMLAVAAEDAVRHWKFAPGSGDTIVNLEVNFASPQ
ncbi:MAG TPA: energy transducer TonB [Terracidiphilus sp.]|nr:energy transducer TonB [Terracidiphilus sp.]